LTTNGVSLYARSDPTLTVEQLQYDLLSSFYKLFRTCASASSLSPAVVEPLCGRPLGMAFDSQANLYVADAYKGLRKILRSGSDVSS
jgi:hypothetical protein